MQGLVGHGELGLLDQANGDVDQDRGRHDLEVREDPVQVEGDVEKAHQSDRTVNEIQEGRRQPGQETVQKIMLDGLGNNENIDGAEGNGCHKTDHETQQDEHASSSSGRGRNAPRYFSGPPLG